MKTTTNATVNTKINNAQVLNGLRANRKPVTKLGATAPVVETVAPAKRAPRPAMTKADFAKFAAPADFVAPAPVAEVIAPAPVAPVVAPVIVAPAPVAPAPVAEVIAPVASTQTPEQIAVLNEMRAAKAKTKADLAAKVAAAEAAMPPFVASSTHAGIGADALSARIRESINDMLGFGEGSAMPGWKRKLAAFFSSCMLAYGAGYAIGTVAGYAIVGIASMGASVLWSYLIMIVAALLALYAGMKIGQYVGNYILSGKIDDHAVAVKNKVVGWFTFGESKPKLLAAS